MRMTLAAGTRLGHYEILELIAEVAWARSFKNRVGSSRDPISRLER